MARSQPHDPRTVLAVSKALTVLREPDPHAKARKTDEVREEITSWASESEGLAGVEEVNELDLHEIPDKPARSSLVRIVPPRELKSLGKGGSLNSRKAILHSLTHIESWAVDLSWDIIARFTIALDLPFGFVLDFATVASDEARHFSLLRSRLEELGGSYGDYPAHDGLWESAEETSASCMSRLAVEHCVHEARGLDVLPQTIGRFRKNGDEATAVVLETVVYPEEITHCAAGLKWFAFLHVRDHCEGEEGDRDGCLLEIESLRIGETFSIADILERHGFDRAPLIESFHSCVRSHFHGRLKPPFNEEARARAGFTAEFYEPLAG